LLPILSNPAAAGRTYALHSTDEVIPDSFNYLDAPLHVIGLITMKTTVVSGLIETLFFSCLGALVN
jgi:hypothetical protein